MFHGHIKTVTQKVLCAVFAYELYVTECVLQQEDCQMPILNI